MYGHAFEWAGFGNYTKGLPQYQGGMLASNKFTYYGTSELGGRVYFTGFNEEGFSVSPRGVEDIQTGEVLAVEEINAPDLELDIPTNFDALTVGTLDAGTINVSTALNISGTISGLPEATPALRASSSWPQFWKPPTQRLMTRQSHQRVWPVQSIAALCSPPLWRDPVVRGSHRTCRVADLRRHPNPQRQHQHGSGRGG